MKPGPFVRNSDDCSNIAHLTWTGTLSRVRYTDFCTLFEHLHDGHHEGQGEMANFYDTLAPAVAELIQGGDSVELEGFTHLIPSAVGHELIRQGRRHLTLIRLTPDIIYDQLIGMGAADRLVFSWGGTPGVGSLHRFRDAVERGWPHPLEIEEHSHVGLANAYVAGASGLPFGLFRGYIGGELVRRGHMVPLRSPFTDEELIAVPAVRPDVTAIHAQQADRDGNVMLWGMTGIHKEAVLAARRKLVTVDEVVIRFD